MSSRPSSIRSRAVKSMKGVFTTRLHKDIQSPTITSAQKRATNLTLQLLAAVSKNPEEINLTQGNTLNEPIRSVTDTVTDTAEVLRDMGTKAGPAQSTESKNLTELQMYPPTYPPSSTLENAITRDSANDSPYPLEQKLHKTNCPSTQPDLLEHHRVLHNNDNTDDHDKNSQGSHSGDIHTSQHLHCGPESSMVTPASLSGSQPRALTSIPKEVVTFQSTFTETRDRSVPSVVNESQQIHNSHPISHPSQAGFSHSPTKPAPRDPPSNTCSSTSSNQPHNRSCGKSTVDASSCAPRPSPAGKTHLRLKLDAHTPGFIPLPALPTPKNIPSLRNSINPGLLTSTYGNSPTHPPESFTEGRSGMGTSLSRPITITAKTLEQGRSRFGEHSSSIVHEGWLSSENGGSSVGIPSISTASSVTHTRARSSSRSTIDIPRSPANRSMRSTMPALRRDGSSFYTTIDSAPALYPREGSGTFFNSEESTNGIELVESPSSEDDEGSEEVDNSVASDDEDVGVPVGRLKIPLPNVKDIIGKVFTMGIGASEGTSSDSLATEAGTTIRRGEHWGHLPSASITLSTVATGDSQPSLNALSEQVVAESGAHASHTPRADLLQQHLPASSVKLRGSVDGESDSNQRHTVYWTPLQTPRPSSAKRTLSSSDQNISEVHQMISASAMELSTGAEPSEQLTGITTSKDGWPVVTLGRYHEVDISHASTLGLGVHSGYSEMYPISAKSLESSDIDRDAARPVLQSATPLDPLLPPQSPEQSPSTVRGNTDEDRDEFGCIPSRSNRGSYKSSRNRPPMYTHGSQSMIDFSKLKTLHGDSPSSNKMDKGKGKVGSSQGPADATVMGPNGADILLAGSSTLSTRSDVMVQRRMSLPDLALLKNKEPPPYNLPGTLAREDEGKEALPPYSCSIHFEGSMPMKMEFSSPGILAKDRSWRKVWVVLNGTCLWIYKFDPRIAAVKSASGNTKAGGRKADGVVGVGDVVVGAPHVHLPEEVINARASFPIKPSQNKDRHRPLGSASERALSATSGRHSFDNRDSYGTGHMRSSNDGASTPSFTASRRPGGVRSSLGSSSSMQSNASTSSIRSSSSTSITTPRVSADSEKFPFVRKDTPTRSPHIYHSAHSNFLTTFKSNYVLKCYSLQQAETGLASDYHKRKNVIRVRADGEQFLLQAENVTMTVDWIETFQAGANVALELDVRPMPKLPALPRRRRRRRPQTESEPAQAEASASSTVNDNIAPSNSNANASNSTGPHQRFPFSRSRLI
ncbi:hypothetical protein FRC03_009203 [Tulasnella sp. 419]|nr:hypothetical protein FRC03_009203 [Tulasnella sp. 419]